MIPIECQNAEYKLSDPVTVMIGDADIEDITALNINFANSKMTFAVIEHDVHAVTSEYELNVYELQNSETTKKSSVVCPFNRDLTEKFIKLGTYDSNKELHNLYPMPFGGYLAFTPSKVLYFANKDYSKPYATQGLFKDISKVKCFCPIDSMIDPENYRSNLFRGIFYTENGQLYLVIFDLERLKSNESFQFMSITYQGTIESARCMSYLGDGHFI